MLSSLISTLIGTPLPTLQLAEKRLYKIHHRAATSPDILSSIAYACQEIYLGLDDGAALLLDHMLGLAVSLTAGSALLSKKMKKEKPL
jgi:hypothetical protein